MELKELCGKHILQGIELGTTKVQDWWGERTAQCVKFALDGITYIAVEDPDDGYRSYCRELKISDTPCEVSLPNIDVVCLHRTNGIGYASKSDVLEFVDCNNGKTILLVGTNNTDDYYPVCTFEYTPENLSCNDSVSD